MACPALSREVPEQGSRTVINSDLFTMDLSPEGIKGGVVEEKPPVPRGPIPEEIESGSAEGCEVDSYAGFVGRKANTSYVSIGLERI